MGIKDKVQLLNWGGLVWGGGMDRGKIGISDAFLMHFGFFRNFRSRKTFLMHF